MNEDYLAGYIELEKNQIIYITGSWLMAGIVIVNVVMVIVATLGIMVEDEENHNLMAFIVTPTSRMTLILSYVIASCINAFIFSILTFLCSQVYLKISCGVVLITIFSLVSFFMCITILVHSASAFSAITSIVGTLIGFIAGIYLPMGSLSEGIQNTLKVFPVIYGTALTRQVYMKDALEGAFGSLPSEVVADYKAFMGVIIRWGNQEVNLGYSLLILIGSGVLFTCIAFILLNYKKVSDR